MYAQIETSYSVSLSIGTGGEKNRGTGRVEGRKGGKGKIPNYNIVTNVSKKNTGNIVAYVAMPTKW